MLTWRCGAPRDARSAEEDGDVRVEALFGVKPLKPWYELLFEANQARLRADGCGDGCVRAGSA